MLTQVTQSLLLERHDLLFLLSQRYAPQPTFLRGNQRAALALNSGFCAIHTPVCALYTSAFSFRKSNRRYMLFLQLPCNQTFPLCTGWIRVSLIALVAEASVRRQGWRLRQSHHGAQECPTRAVLERVLYPHWTLALVQQLGVQHQHLSSLGFVMKWHDKTAGSPETEVGPWGGGWGGHGNCWAAEGTPRSKEMHFRNKLCTQKLLYISLCSTYVRKWAWISGLSNGPWGLQVMLCPLHGCLNSAMTGSEFLSDLPEILIGIFTNVNSRLISYECVQVFI